MMNWRGVWVSLVDVSTAGIGSERVSGNGVAKRVRGRLGRGLARGLHSIRVEGVPGICLGEM